MITDIIRSFYANFFTVGTLVPTVFHLFLAVLFLSIPNKSKSSFHIAFTFIYMFLFNFGYFIASSFYHPLAAYHRWITVGTILLCEAHTNMFIYYFHEERYPLFGKIFLGLQYVVSIFLTYIFYTSTYHAEKIYIINAHQWDFNADDISRLIGIVIQGYVVIFLFITVWKVLTIKTRERWIILLMSISYVVITIVPSATNVMSRSGLLTRETFQIMWNMFNILGFTFLTILAINFTRDRSSVLVKIIGVSLVTILMLFQGFSYFLYTEQESAYDRLHSVFTRLTAETDETFGDSEYLVTCGLAGGGLSVNRQKREGVLFDGNAVSSSLFNTALWKEIDQLGDADFKKSLYGLIEDSHPSFAGYKMSIEDGLRRMDGALVTKKSVQEFIVGIQRSIRGEKHAILNLPDKKFRKSLNDFLAGNSSESFIFFKKAILAHMSGSGSEEAVLKSEIMSYLQPVTPPGTRHYRIAGENHFVAFHYIDLAKRMAYEVGYSYLSYRENLHPAAVKFVYMLFVIIFIVLFGFPLFFRGILVAPLFSLVHGLDRVEKGDYEFRIPVLLKDEIGFVTHSFNKMAETIRDDKKKLDSYTQNLEEMVKARTGELEQAYDKMRESEERFREIIENVTEGIHIVNSMGEIVYMNPLGLKKIGYTNEEIKGKNYIDMVRPEFREKAALFYLDQIKNNIEETYLECPIVTKDGRNIWIGMSVKLYRDKEGKLGFYCIARDITDRVKAQEALRESEEKYRRIVESATDGIFRNDIRGNFLYVNPTGQILLGYPIDELMTMNYQSLVQPDYAEKIRDAYRHQIKNRLQETYLEFPVIRKDGTVRWLGQRVQLEKNSKGEYEFHGISRDVTEKVIAEESLRMSEEKYRTILETIREGYYEVDLKGNITFVNNSVCNLWGFSKDEIVGLNFRNLVTGDDAETIYNEFNKLYMGLDHASIVTYKIIHKNGKELDFEQTFDGITDKNGRIIGFRGVVRDVTERIIALEALRASEEKYRLLIENAGDIIYHCDWRGFFIYFSPSAYRLSGYSPEDIIGKHFSEIIPPNSRQAVVEYYLEQFKERTTQSYYELPILIKDGSVMWVGQVVSIVTGADGKIEFYSIA
ncbi:MAG: PAS domain S-box protein, partial [Spirochaetes bacterium]|nr:PAS domain S-box protein [Spirochaetota bacterium]